MSFVATGIGRYVRQHHLGLLCLFLIIGGGTAWALERNSVESKHIVNGQVKGPDLADGIPSGVEIVNNAGGNSSENKTVEVDCPEGKEPIGRGRGPDWRGHGVRGAHRERARHGRSPGLVRHRDRGERRLRAELGDPRLRDLRQALGPGLPLRDLGVGRLALRAVAAVFVGGAGLGSVPGCIASSETSSTAKIATAIEATTRAAAIQNETW